jgi:glutaredoxin
MSSVRLAALAAVVGCATLWGAASEAQVFRIIGPDGKVTYTDRPPPDGKATAAPTVSTPGGGGSSLALLPAEVRAAATRFPVTIYTTADCAPCISARNLLASRGVPYSEKTVSTKEDVQALQGIAGDARLPFATIGGQHVRGFSDSEWSQYLDAAGYPKGAQLPASFRNPAPTPLVAVQSAPAAAGQARAQAQQPQAANAPAPAPSDPSPTNPAGIRF